MRWMRVEELVEYHTVCALHSAITTGVPEYIADTIGAAAGASATH